MTETTITLPHYTTKEYEQWQDNWELINGIPFYMTLANNNHQYIATLLYNQFYEQLKDTPYTIQGPMNVKFADDIIVQPDLLVLHGMPDRDSLYLTTLPFIVVEILSDATRKKDTTVKKELYANYAIPYYVIVDPKTKTVTIYSECGETTEHVKQTYRFMLPYLKGMNEIIIDFANLW
jgi:Uma2 family endonuclease